MKYTQLPPRCAIVELIDGTFAVTFDGVQWGNDGKPRDSDGCSSQTWPTYNDALEAVLADN